MGHLVTELSGSSDYFAGGVVAYANDVKERALAVPPELIARHGAVSPEVAAAMARGALEQLASDVAVAVTGIAGPEGGSAEKPVGLTFVAAASRRGASRLERHVLPHDRAGNKRAAALAALRLAAALAAAEPRDP